MTKWQRPSSDALRAIAERVRRGERYVPPYQGRYFTQGNLHFTPPDRNSQPWIYEANIRNLPTDEKIAEVLAYDPRAEDLMRLWRATFDLSFPGWTDGSVFPDFANGISDYENAMRLIEKDIANHENALSGEDYLFYEIHIKWLQPDKRDYRLHAIDDAETIRSLINLEPGQAIIFMGNFCLDYSGRDVNGTPVLSFASTNAKTKRRSRDSSNPYWTWEFFKKYMKRHSVTVRGDRDLNWTLADMASQGYEKAFIKNCASKGGTWTIDLSGIRFFSDASKRVESVIYPHNLSMKAMVQEHLPFTHEQRFFIVDGRVVASVCSDRNFSTLDQLKGKRLDSRVARLSRPEIDHGEFDRGLTDNVEDRQLSAQFARMARQIAADARSHGILDYVVDLGLTARGPAAIEVNELELSGPYALNRDWITRAYSRRAKEPADMIAAEAA